VKAAPEAPVDLTGVTLTGADGASWSSVVGNGSAMTGPAARIARVTGNDRAGHSDGAVGGKGTEPALVAEASLSRKPVPPDGMDALLEQNFPARARAQGVSGTALLRVRIMADGRVGDMQTVRETGDYGFGAACMKALKQRRWQPPLDKRGAPVATEIRYSCEFEVSY
jgi:TonB family protein